MRSALVIANREIRGFFLSPIAYIVLTVWTLCSGFVLYFFAEIFAERAFAQEAAQSASDNPLSWFFGGTILFYMPLLVFVPAITMRLIAEERRSGTIEPLLTAPISGSAVIAGKYLAALAFWIALWLPTGLYVWILSYYGDIDLGVVGASYLGIFGVGLYYMAIGLLMSAISHNQITAALLTFMMLGLLFLIGLAESIFPDSRDLFSYISVYGHMEVFSKGIVDSRALVYDASLAILALFLAGGALSQLRGTATSKLGGFGRRAIGSLLVLAIVLMVNYLSFRHYARWDWTEASQFTLSERTEQVLSTLDQDVDIYLFLSEGEFPLYDDTRELLERYRAISPRIETHFVDPRRDRQEFELLLSRFNVREVTTDGVVDIAAVVASGDRHWRVTRGQLRHENLDFDSDEKQTIDIEAERAFTGAILEVVEGATTKVCVASGHGEWPLDAGSEASLYGLREIARLDNFDVESVEIDGSAPISDDCTALVIVAPTRFFDQESSQRVEDYLHSGGNALLALEPILDRERLEPTGFENLASEYGVLIDPSLAAELDEQLLLSPIPIGTFRVRTFGAHAVVEPLARMEAQVAVAGTRTLRKVPGSIAVPLLQGSEHSYGETNVRAILEAEFNHDPEDIEGPVILALAAEPDREGEGGRLLVFGDANWMEPGFLGHPSFGNGVLLSTSLGWLTDREAMISIPPRQIDARPMVMSEGDLSYLAIRLLALIPGAIVLLGFATWWSRRS